MFYPMRIVYYIYIKNNLKCLEEKEEVDPEVDQEAQETFKEEGKYDHNLSNRVDRVRRGRKLSFRGSRNNDRSGRPSDRSGERNFKKVK